MPVEDFGVDRQLIVAIHVDEGGHTVVTLGRIGGEVQDVALSRPIEGGVLASIFDY